MKTVLVSGASGVVGYGVLRCLRMSGRPLRLVGTSIYPESPANAFSDVFELAPRTSADRYLDWLCDIIRRHEVDLVLPGIEEDVFHWTEHAAAIRAAGAVPALNEPALVRLCADKWAFHERLAVAGLACAIDTALDLDFDALAARFGTPFIVKPRRGFGSKGVARISTAFDLAAHRAAFGDLLMAQRLVGTDDLEFTVTAFGDGLGAAPARMAMRRRLSREGFTEIADVVACAPFDAAIDDLCRLFRPVGPTNFQFRLHDGVPKLLEINPRVSSSASIRAAFGYNECAMAVDYFLFGKVPVQPPLRGGRAIRYTDEVVTYDDRVHL